MALSTERKRDLLLTGLIGLGMVMALIYGWGAQRSPALMAALPWFSWMGVLFKQLLLVIIYPLVLASMVVGVVNLGDIRKVGGLAAKGLAYFTLTTALAVALGLILVNIVHPGQGVSLELGAWGAARGHGAAHLRRVLHGDAQEHLQEPLQVPGPR